MKYVDIHCHLDFPDYAEDITSVLSLMKEQEVGAITIGTDIESAKRAVALADAHEHVWACIGVHPVDKPEDGRGTFDEEAFGSLVSHPKVVAVGECGLDWFRMKVVEESERRRQVSLFEQHIEFALLHNKPLMLHCRDSYQDVLDILQVYHKQAGDILRGNAHFFAGTKDQAKQFIDLGFTVSFTGVITFTTDYDEVIEYVPLESIHAETDSPFVAPVPYRGTRNNPVYVKEVVSRIAGIKSIDEESLRKALISNASRVFGLNREV